LEKCNDDERSNAWLQASSRYVLQAFQFAKSVSEQLRNVYGAPQYEADYRVFHLPA
jgi:hypothetical protein